MDENLLAARTALHDAISALIDPRPYLLDHKTTWLDSLWQELLDSLAGVNCALKSGGAARLPLWADCHDLVTAVADDVTEFHPEHSCVHPDPTTARLMVISELSWRPQDTEKITDFTATLIRHTQAIRALLQPESVALIGKPCPYCGSDRIKRRDSAGEMVNTRALSVCATGVASCAVCRRRWVGVTELRSLGRMLT